MCIETSIRRKNKFSYQTEITVVQVYTALWAFCYDRWLEKRRKLAFRYNERLRGNEGKLPSEPPYGRRVIVGWPGDRKNGDTEFFDGSTYGAARPIRRRLSTASYNSRQILVEPQIY